MKFYDSHEFKRIKCPMLTFTEFLIPFHILHSRHEPSKILLIQPHLYCTTHKMFTQVGKEVVPNTRFYAIHFLNLSHFISLKNIVLQSAKNFQILYFKCTLHCFLMSFSKSWNLSLCEINYFQLFLKVSAVK